MNFLTWISRDQREVEVEIEKRRKRGMIQARSILGLILALKEAAVVIVVLKNNIIILVTQMEVVMVKKSAI